MDSAVLSTLRHVTDRKLQKLTEHRQKFETERTSILDSITTVQSPSEKVKLLLEEFEKVGLKAGELPVANIERLLHQAQHDPSISKNLMTEWCHSLEHQLDVQSLKYNFADLFGKLVMEWLNNPNQGSFSKASKPEDEESPSDNESNSDTESDESFETVGRKEMHKQREEWESYTFNAAKDNSDEIKAYLNDLFSSTTQAKKLHKTPLQIFRESMKAFDREIEGSHRFDKASIKRCIRGLLASDLFSGTKREALLGLQNNESVLDEMADVLNMDLDAIKTWNWQPSPVPLEMRKQLNGKYRVFMDPEIHQAILIQYLGMKWAVHLRTAMTSFYHSGAWVQKPYRQMSKSDKLKREYFLGGQPRYRKNTQKCVRDIRRNYYQEHYFMTQLPAHLNAAIRDYQDDGSTDDADPNDLKPHEIKQSMLRLMTTEMLLNKVLYGEFTILQSDFKWFGPSLPHATIFTVLEFFGVSNKWLDFFRKFLEAPMMFSHDGPNGEVKIRTRGVPMSIVLSDALSEAVLFCLDFAVSKGTGGNLYRFHDDLWFWGQEKTCETAWTIMKRFTNTMGLSLNEEKTGSVTVLKEGAKSRKPSSALPQGTIRWGFLSLDSEIGQWTISKTEVTEHISELRHQLAACRSVFAWVQAWNSYVRFFASNFGHPAASFGSSHVDLVVETFSHIQKTLFAKSPGHGSAQDHLKSVIAKRFHASGLPDGFFYLPLRLGGLELCNPLIAPCSLRKNSWRDPEYLLRAALEKEKAEHTELEEKYDSGELRPMRNTGYKASSDDPFLSYSEYIEFVEETSEHMGIAYEKLMEQPSEEFPEQDDAKEQLFQSLRAVTNHDTKQDGYWRWVLEIYGAEVVRRFGDLSMGERGLLPIGLVDMLKNEKVRWLG